MPSTELLWYILSSSIPWFTFLCIHDFVLEYHFLFFLNRSVNCHPGVERDVIIAAVLSRCISFVIQGSLCLSLSRTYSYEVSEREMKEQYVWMELISRSKEMWQWSRHSGPVMSTNTIFFLLRLAKVLNRSLRRKNGKRFSMSRNSFLD